MIQILTSRIKLHENSKLKVWSVYYGEFFLAYPVLGYSLRANNNNVKVGKITYLMRKYACL